MAIEYISFSDFMKALDFIRKAACDDTIADNVVGTNGNPAKRKTLDELTQAETVALLKENGIEVAPGKRVKLVVDTEDVMHVRIPYHSGLDRYPPGEHDPVAGKEPGPGKDMLPQRPADYKYAHLEVQAIYNKFYNIYYGNGASGDTATGPYQDDPGLVVEFNNARLTDYAFSNCK